MSDGSNASWQPDPYGRHELRYWNGTAWTEHISNGGVTGTDAIAAPPAPPQPTTPDTPAQPAFDPNATTIAPQPAADRGAGWDLANASTPEAGTPTGTQPPQQWAAPGATPPPGAVTPPPAVPGAAPAGDAQWAAGAAPTTDSVSSGSKFPVVAVVVGVLVAGLVIFGLVKLLGGGDDEGGLGTSNVTLDDDNRAFVTKVDLRAGEAVRVRAEPRSNNDQDLVIRYAISQSDADLLLDVASEAGFVSDERASDIFDDPFFSVFSDAEETSFDEGELFELESRDREGRGDAEATVVQGLVSSTVYIIVHDYFGEEGDITVTIEKWDDRIDFDDPEDLLLSEFSDQIDDEFFSDDDFFTSDVDFDLDSGSS